MTKQIMIKLLILSLTISLVTACEKCWKVEPVKSCDISFQFDRCRCRCLYLKNDLQTVDPKLCGLDWNTKEKDFPLNKCEGIAGFYLEDIAKKIRPQALETKQCFEDNCKVKPKVDTTPKAEQTLEFSLIQSH